LIFQRIKFLWLTYVFGTPVPDTNENPQTHNLNIHVENCNVSEGAQLSLPVNISKDRKSDEHKDFDVNNVIVIIFFFLLFIILPNIRIVSSIISNILSIISNISSIISKILLIISNILSIISNISSKISNILSIISN